MLDFPGLTDVDYTSQPPVLVFGEDGKGFADAIMAAGNRVVARLPLAEAEARLEMQPSIAAAVLLLGRDLDGAPSRLLRRLNEAAAARRHRATVVLPAALIDRALALAPDPGVELLVDPDPLEVAASVTISCVPLAGPKLHDRGGDGGGLRLAQLSEEVGRIARQLAALVGDPDPRGAPPPAPTVQPAPTPAEAIDAGMIRALIRARRARDQFFPADLFADPAWDILLDLAAARKEDRQVAVSSLCIAAAVPPTTALRWIKALTDRGLLVRLPGEHDGRRVHIALADEAAEAMDACLAAIRRASRNPA